MTPPTAAPTDSQRVIQRMIELLEQGWSDGPPLTRVQELAALRAAADLRARVEELRQRVYTQVSMCAECDLAEQFIADLDTLLKGEQS